MKWKFVHKSYSVVGRFGLVCIVCIYVHPGIRIHETGLLSHAPHPLIRGGENETKWKSSYENVDTCRLEVLENNYLVWCSIPRAFQFQNRKLEFGRQRAGAWKNFFEIETIAYSWKCECMLDPEFHQNSDQSVGNELFIVLTGKLKKSTLSGLPPSKFIDYESSSEQEWRLNRYKVQIHNGNNTVELPYIF